MGIEKPPATLGPADALRWIAAQMGHHTPEGKAALRAAAKIEAAHAPKIHISKLPLSKLFRRPKK